MCDEYAISASNTYTVNINAKHTGHKPFAQERVPHMEPLRMAIQIKPFLLQFN